MSNEFDDFDDLALGDALRRRSGRVPDADAALGTFHRRVRVARVRRMSIAASGTAAVALVTVGAFALTGGGKPNGDITPADRSGVLDSIVDSLPGTDTTVGTSVAPDGGSSGSGDTGTTGGTSPTGTSGNSSPGGTPTGSSGGGQQSGGTTSTTVDDSGDDSSDDGHGSGDGSGESGSEGHSGSGSTSTTAVPVLVTKRCTSTGGSFTANHLTKSSVSDISPAAGFYKSEQEVETNQITVVFKNGEVEYHLVARWNGSSFSCSVGS